MTPIRAITILFASLALISIADAQKGKPGGGGGTTPPPPYSPVVVNVACDGTGTKLQDALNALNPVANVYEVRVSGVCPESLVINGFAGLTLTSPTAGSASTIGRIESGTSGFGSKITIRNLNLSSDYLAAAMYIFDSEIQAEDVVFVCTTRDGCANLITAFQSKIRTSGLRSENFIQGGAISVDRHSFAFIGMASRTNPEFSCSDLDLLRSRRGSYVSYTSEGGTTLNNQPCNVNRVTAEFGGEIFLVNQGLTDVFTVEGGSVYGGNTLGGRWYGAVSCAPYSVVSDIEDPTVNRCVP